MKLFDIPIFDSQYHDNSKLDIANPQDIWDYNGCVGYVTVYTFNNDIRLRICLPNEGLEAYDSNHRVILHDIEANGTHFYVDENMSNSDIREHLLNELLYIQETHIPKRYNIDREAFDTLNPLVDYKAIFDKH